MKIQPILHRILVKPEAIEDVDENMAKVKNIPGFVIAGQERDREQAAIDTGTVVDMGATVFRDFGTDNPLKVGDKVVYARHGGKTITDKDTKTKYVLLNDEDIVAIIT